MAQSSGNVSNVLGIGGVSVSSAPLAPDLLVAESNTQGYFTLFAGKSMTSGNFYILYKNGVAYQVPNGKTCKVVGVIATCSAANSSFQLCSATASFAEGAGTITGGVYQAGASTNAALFTGAGYAYTRFSVLYDFASDTYPAIQAGGSYVYNIALICKEV